MGVGGQGLLRAVPQLAAPHFVIFFFLRFTKHYGSSLMDLGSTETWGCGKSAQLAVSKPCRCGERAGGKPSISTVWLLHTFKCAALAPPGRLQRPGAALCPALPLQRGCGWNKKPGLLVFQGERAPAGHRRR